MQEIGSSHSQTPFSLIEAMKGIAGSPLGSPNTGQFCGKQGIFWRISYEQHGVSPHAKRTANGFDNPCPVSGSAGGKVDKSTLTVAVLTAVMLSGNHCKLQIGLRCLPANPVTVARAHFSESNYSMWRNSIE